MSEPELLLCATGLQKRYTLGRRSLEVLRGVSLEVPRGGFVALQGASGAGKSTLLHLLGGLDTPDAGSVRIQGRELSKLSGSALARFRNEKVGFIFQAYHLFPEFDALENVMMPARMAHRDAGETRRRATRLLEQVGLGQRLDHRPYELSGGEQQRVAIARALINDPELILADEPTGNLDSHTGQEILELLCHLRDDRQRTLLVATHDGRVAARAPVIVRLEDGQVCDRPSAGPAE